MSANVPVRLLRQYRANNRGEVAGFPRERAAWLIEHGYAEEIDAAEEHRKNLAAAESRLREAQEDEDAARAVLQEAEQRGDGRAVTVARLRLDAARERCETAQRGVEKAREKLDPAKQSPVPETPHESKAPSPKQTKKPPSTGAQRESEGGRKKVGRPKTERASGIGACIDAKNWRGVAMTVTDSGTVAIAGPGHKRASYTLQELGLAEATGRLFVFLAQGKGQYNAFDEPEYGSNPGVLKRHVSRINTALCAAFGFSDNPVTCKDGNLSAVFQVNTEGILPWDEERARTPKDEDAETLSKMFSDHRHE